MSQYATKAFWASSALPQAMLDEITDDEQDSLLSQASSVIDGYISSRFALPITAWGDDLKRHCCNIATWLLISRKGLNPTEGSNLLFRQNYDDSIRFLENFFNHRVNLVGIVDATAVDEIDEGGPFVVCDDPRGW